MELIKQLEKQLETQWQKASSAKKQDEVQKLRAEALETYRLIKKQRIQIGQ